MSHQTTVNEILLRAQVKELASEFRRLAAEKRATAELAEESGATDIARSCWDKERVWEQAAQMLEEELNG